MTAESSVRIPASAPAATRWDALESLLGRDIDAAAVARQPSETIDKDASSATSAEATEAVGAETAAADTVAAEATAAESSSLPKAAAAPRVGLGAARASKGAKKPAKKAMIKLVGESKIPGDICLNGLYTVLRSIGQVRPLAIDSLMTSLMTL